MIDPTDGTRGRGVLLSSVLAVAIVFALGAVVLRTSPHAGTTADAALALAVAGGLHLVAALVLDRMLRRSS